MCRAPPAPKPLPHLCHHRKTDIDQAPVTHGRSPLPPVPDACRLRRPVKRRRYPRPNLLDRAGNGCSRLRTPAPWPVGRCSHCGPSSASPSSSPDCRSSPTPPSSTRPIRRPSRPSSPRHNESAPSTPSSARSLTSRCSSVSSSRSVNWRLVSGHCSVSWPAPPRSVAWSCPSCSSSPSATTRTPITRAPTSSSSLPGCRW